MGIHQKGTNVDVKTFVPFHMERPLYRFLCMFLQIDFQQQVGRVFGNGAAFALLHKILHILQPIIMRFSPVNWYNNKKQPIKSSRFHRLFQVLFYNL